jgi:Flp pilus assembly protein TadG
MIARFLTPLLRFLRAREGVSAVEFALLAPVLIVMYFGLAELSQAFMAQRRTQHTASTIGDLVAQARSVSSSDLTDIFTIGKLVMKPFTTTGMTQRISSVTMTGGVAKVDWSSGSGISARSTGSSVTVPANLMTNGESIVMAEVSYVYHSPADEILPNAITFNQTYYLRPRLVDKVPKT